MANYCPTRLDSLSDRSNSLGCDERNKYHCLRNKKDEMVEKCFEVSWIQKGDCAVYDTDAQTIDAWPCNINRGECPTRDYLSNDVMSYSACIPFSRTTNSSDGNLHGNFPNEVESKSANLKLIIPLVIVPLVLIIIIAIIILKRILQIRKRARNTNQDDENTVPLMLIDNPSKKDEKEEQKYKHLEKEEEHLKLFECKGECPKHMLETIKKHLQNQTNVLIIGKPGSGKTTLAWTLCKQMHGESFEGQIWYVKASTSTKDLPNREEMTLILLLDGRFEDAVRTEDMVKKVLDEVEAQRIKLPRKQMRTIVTISHEAYWRISKFELIGKLNPMGIIDLDDRTNTFTNAEMTKVLETYDIPVKNVKGANESKVLSQKQLQAIYECFNHSWLGKKINTIPNIGFPLVAALMSLNPNFLGNIDFVQEPIRHVLESIDQLRQSTNRTAMNTYCTLVYASFKGGKVDTNNVDQDLLKEIGIRHRHPKAQIDPDFYVLRNIRDTVYEFLHESLLHAFLSAYGGQNTKFVITYCPLNVLLENSVSIRDNISRKEEMFFMTIGTEYEKELIHRIINEKFDIRHHRMWEQNIFQEKYKTIYAKGDELKEK